LAPSPAHPASPAASGDLLALRLGASGLIEVLLPFDPVTQAQLRAVRPRGHWSSSRGCWEFPPTAALALQTLLNGRFPVSAELAEWLAWMQ